MNNFDKQGYFSTHEFAKLVGVTKHTLFHYDKVGVFSPEIKLENDYRYYSYTQIEYFGVISTLKELGMSLSEIKAYLDRRTPQYLILLLKEREKEIEVKINHLIQMKKLISHKAQVTKEALTIENHHPFITTETKEVLLVSKVLEPKSKKGLGLAIGNHMSNCKSHGILPRNAIGNMIHINNIKQKDYHKYQYFFTKTDIEEQHDNIYIKPAGRYLNIIHKEGFYSTHNTYEDILDYANKNHLSLDDFFYEDVLLDELSIKGYENYIVKISIRILN